MPPDRFEMKYKTPLAVTDGEKSFVGPFTPSMCVGGPSCRRTGDR